MASENQVNILKALRKILEKQAQLTLKGNFDTKRFDELARQGDVLVRKIAQTKIFEGPEFTKQKADLQKSYQQLCLALGAQKDDVARQLKQAGKWKRTIQTYQKSF